jgi:hypothetical protein
MSELVQDTRVTEPAVLPSGTLHRTLGLPDVTAGGAHDYRRRHLGARRSSDLPSRGGGLTGVRARGGFECAHGAELCRAGLNKLPRRRGCRQTVARRRRPRARRDLIGQPPA